MYITEVTLSKDQLLHLPSRERLLLILFGHAHNELVVFYKLFLQTIHNDFDGVQLKTNLAQSLIIIRLLIAKLFETNILIEKVYFKSKLSKDIEPSLSENTLASLKNLKNFIKKNNNFYKHVRDRYSSHYNHHEVRELSDLFYDNSDFNIFLNEDHMNCFYYLSELVVTASLLDHINSDDPKAAMDKLILSTKPIVSDTLYFLNGCIDYVIETYIDNFNLPSVIKEYEISAPNMNEQDLHFFIERNIKFRD